MSSYAKKCKRCKGSGVMSIGKIVVEDCYYCEGSGIQLFSHKEEEYNDAVELIGDKVYADSIKFIDLEEEDYEI